MDNGRCGMLLRLGFVPTSVGIAFDLAEVLWSMLMPQKVRKNDPMHRPKNDRESTGSCTGFLRVVKTLSGVE